MGFLRISPGALVDTRVNRFEVALHSSPILPFGDLPRPPGKLIDQFTLQAPVKLRVTPAPLFS